ncbi:MAG: hypothetical protein Q8N16_02705 [bacterium]|nr:hypothetical protein [bacterium]
MIVILIVTFFSIGNKILQQHTIRQFNTGINSKIYLIDGWLDIAKQSVIKSALTQPTIDENRFVVSERIFSRDGQHQAIVTADRKVLGYKGVLPDPKLIVSDSQGNISKTFLLRYEDTQKNVPGYVISFSKNGEQIALLSQQNIEVINTHDDTTTHVDLASNIQEICKIGGRPKSECDDFSFYHWKHRSVLDWLDENNVLIRIYGFLYKLNVSSKEILRLQGLDYVDRFQVLNSETIAYIYIPNWNTQSGRDVIRIYNINKKEIIQTYPKKQKFGIDALAASPDGKYLLLGDTSCLPWDIDCGGPYRITVELLDMATGNRARILSNYNYKQNSPVDIYWITD